MNTNILSRRLPASRIAYPASLLLIMLVWNIPAFCGEIHDAVVAGELETVEALLKGNPELANGKDEDSYTPLHFADLNVQKGVVEILLAFGN